MTYLGRERLANLRILMNRVRPGVTTRRLSIGLNLAFIFLHSKVKLVRYDLYDSSGLPVS